MRTWHVVVPIAAARRDHELLEPAASWYEELEDVFPDTPYARLSRAAVDTIFRRAGVIERQPLDMRPLRRSFAEDIGLPSWFEALDVVLAEALAEGALREVGDAVEIFTASLEQRRTRAGESAHALLLARTCSARGEGPERVRALVSAVRSEGGPWPLLKCLRLLVADGVADSSELADVSELSARLGV